MLNEDVTNGLSLAWATLLEVEMPMPDSNFFGDGGDSLLAVELSEIVQSKFGVPLSLKALFQDGSFSAVAAAVNAELARSVEERR